MVDEEDADAKVPWRSIVLWIIAAAVGGIASYMYSQAQHIHAIREEQIINTRNIGDLMRRVDSIENTKVDKRFRSDDWEAQRKILDAEFRSVWKAIEECRRPQSMR